MRVFLLVPAGVCAGVLGLAEPASAQTACAPRALIVDRLARQFGEAPQSVGLVASDTLIEVFASDESGTWTILMTRADGISCLVANGSAFETLAQILPGRPA
ncbi:hypothetical protein [Roseivivax sp. CAU 1753]